MAPPQLVLLLGLLCIAPLCAAFAQEDASGLTEMELFDQYVAEQGFDPELVRSQPLRALRVDRMLVAINPSITITASPANLTVSVGVVGFGNAVAGMPRLGGAYSTRSEQERETMLVSLQFVLVALCQWNGCLTPLHLGNCVATPQHKHNFQQLCFSI